jgi:hypothetical protein
MLCQNTSFYSSLFRTRWRTSDLSTALSVLRGIANVLRWLASQVAAESIKYGETANAFTVVTRNPDATLAPCNFECVLRFGVIQVDPKSGEDESDPFDKEYPLEELELSTSDFGARRSRVPMALSQRS